MTGPAREQRTPPRWPVAVEPADPYLCDPTDRLDRLWDRVAERTNDEIRAWVIQDLRAIGRWQNVGTP